MQFPPYGFVPPEDALTVANGDPARGSDVQAVDLFATWLSASYKRQRPQLGGAYYESGTTFRLTTRLQEYTPSLRFGFLCHGRGTITLTGSDDAYTIALSVKVGTGDSGTHSLEEAEWVFTGWKKDSVVQNGLNRALDVTLSSSMRLNDLTWVITDAGSQTLRVYGIKVLADVPNEHTQLT